MTIWTNQFFDESHASILRHQIGGHRLLISNQTSKSNLATGQRDSQALEADILYGQPDVRDVLESSKLRWLQLTTAGYTRFDKPEILSAIRQKGVAFCNASALYDEPCAQHVVAMLLSLARALPLAALEQQQARWNYLPLRAQSFLLRGQKVAIAGYGAIARRVVELLSPYKLDITAFRRTVRGDENCPTRPADQIDQYLPDADIVINILPSSPSTSGFFNGDRINRIKHGAVYLNIGRGDTNDQDALASALREGRLGHVYLDVTAPEPLPEDHALWTAPHCHITPHTAGGSFDEPKRMIEHFIENLRRFERGEALADRII